MADGVAIDANVISNFYSDYLRGFDSPSRITVEQSIARLGIVVDEGGRIQHEWFGVCPGPFLREWFLEQVKLGRIRLVKSHIELHHKKKLKNDLGFPADDFTYIAVANVTQIRYIVTDDIDFHDPKLKCADHRRKLDAKETRRGAVCSYLRSHMRITVGTPAHAIRELFPVTR